MRRRRWALGASLTLALVITVTSVVAALAFAQNERESKHQSRLIETAAAERALAAADTGLVDLDLQLFDWDAQTLTPHPLPAAEFANLQVSLWEVDTPDAPTPDRPREGQFVRLSRPTVQATHWRTELQTHSGPVFLRIDGRGRNGESCPPSWLKALRLPGWSARATGPTKLPLLVPTCTASRLDVATIPAGPFYFAGIGEPEIPGHILPEPERRVDLPTFRIDRTETPNAWFAAFASNHLTTGVDIPEYPRTMVDQGLRAPDRPVVAIDAFVADAFCAWLGKALPTSEEWTKAGRGGLTLDAAGQQINPEPRRNLPWGKGTPSAQFNLHDSDLWPLSAPVTVGTAEASPYGVLGLADNVAEWTASSPSSNGRSLRTMRGGDWGTYVVDGVHSLAIENQRPPRFFAFSTGFRCSERSMAEGARPLAAP